MVDGDVAGTCTEECQHDQDCHGEGKCCSNGCGHVCMTPIQGELETRLQIIEIECDYGDLTLNSVYQEQCQVLFYQDYNILVFITWG